MIEIEQRYNHLDKEDSEANNDYATKLHLAVKDNNLRYVQRLIGDGVHVQSLDKFGRTPLHWALVFGYQKVSYALIINTPKIGLEHKDNCGCTPLHYAALGGRTDVGRVLLERGAFINSIDSKIRTPLHYAAQNAKPDMVEMLVSRGANKTCLDYKGFLPSDIALGWGNFSSLVCLRQNELLEGENKSKTNEVQNIDCLKAEVQALPNESMSSEIKCIMEEEPSTSKRKSPSLDKLMLAWKNIQNNAKKKREIEAKWIAKASLILEEKLQQWREAEKEAIKYKAWSESQNNSCTQGLRKTQSSSAIRSCQHIYKHRVSQFNCGESSSDFEASNTLKDPINSLAVSTSPSFALLPSSGIQDPASRISRLDTQLSLPIYNDNFPLDQINPQLDNSMLSNIETTVASKPPTAEVCQTNATSCLNQNVANDQNTVACTPTYSCSTSLTNAISPNSAVLIPEDKHDRFWRCKEPTSTKPKSATKILVEEATNSSNVAQSRDDVRWCTEWEFEMPEVFVARLEPFESNREVQALPETLNICNTNLLVDKGKGKATTFFEEEPKWVQVWPKPSPSSSSFSSMSKTIT